MDRAYPPAEHLAANYQVLVWDRRNTGASDLAIEDAPSEVHLWADDLHHLLGALNMSPAYLGGTSNGQMLSLLMAHRYPQDVRGLILANTPTDDLDLMGRLWYAHSTEAQLRIASGQSKPEDFDWLLSWVAETISMNPSDPDRLLDTDPKQFSTLMRKWGRSILSGRPQLAGLTEDQVRGISVPALVAHGFNPFHPRRAAETLYRLLPNAEWVEYTDRFTRQEIDQAQDKGTLRRPFVEAFLRKVEHASLDE